MMKIVEKITRARKVFKFESNLLESHKTKVAHIEFTSNCNLRCVYCHASQPNYKGSNLHYGRIEDVKEVFKKRGVTRVCMNGHGETTLYHDWHLYCNNFLDDGLSLVITSNFAKKFSDDEIDTLSRFAGIEISCDTCHPRLFEKLRRGNHLHTLCSNISKLKTIAQEKARSLPTLSFSCVVSDQNIFHLQEFVDFSLNLGIRHFNFCNLIKYPDIKNAMNPKHISELSPDLLLKAQETLFRTFATLDDLGIEYHYQQGLLDSLKFKMKSLNEPPTVNTKTGDKPFRYSSPQREGQTRDCLEPWEFVMISSESEVYPCCGHAPVYKLGKYQSLREVFNNIPMKVLRQRLLDGDLPEDCLYCTRAGWTSTQNLQKRVHAYLNPARNIFLFKKPYIKINTFKEFNLTYQRGWYDLENDITITDSDCRQWRWTSKRASCTLTNPRKNGLLIIRGACPIQDSKEFKIILKLNSTDLDEFCFKTSKFYIEYLIGADRMGDDEQLVLEISTDRTFIPANIDPQSDDRRELGLQVFHLFFGEKKQC